MLFKLCNSLQHVRDNWAKLFNGVSCGGLQLAGPGSGDVDTYSGGTDGRCSNLGGTELQEGVVYELVMCMCGCGRRGGRVR